MNQTTKKKTSTKKVGSVLVGKEGGFYIKFQEPIELTLVDKSGKAQKVKSQFLNLDKPEDVIKRLASFGVITEEQAEERLNKLPDFVKYELSVSVPKE